MSGGWYSVQELAGLPGMPGSERGAFKALKKNLCVARSKESGKGREYPLTCLPKETQAALLARELAAQAGKPPFHTPATPATPSLPATTSPTPVAARPVSAPADLTDRQRHIEGARKYVLAEVSLLMAQVGCGREAAMHALLVNAAAGTAEAQVMAALALARDTRGRKRAAGAEAPRPLPSVRTLKRWLAADVAGVPCSLAPRVARQKMDVPPWAGAFLTHYQQPQKPSVDAAYRAFLAEAVIQGAAIDTLPSIHQIRRLIQKIGAV